MEDASSASSPASPGGVLGHRRSFVVNRRYQARAGLLTATVTAVLLTFINLVLFSSMAKTSHRMIAENPELAELIKSQDRLSMYMTLLASVVFLVGVITVTLLESHKTAGAAHNLANRMREVSGGRFNVQARLRRGDNLRELEAAFNDMTRSLQERAREETATLQALAEEAGRIGHPGVAPIADRLRKIADGQRTRYQ